MSTRLMYDCTGAALAAVNVPPGAQMAAYVTGFPPVPWTTEQLAAHPGAVLIDQAPINTPADETADVYDLENRAGTLTGLPEWVHGAWASYTSGRRPGQRKPTVYVDQSNVTPAVNQLLAVGITHGVNIWLAAQMSADQAAAAVTTASGPFPIVAVQFSFLPDHDVSIVSDTWLEDVSLKPKVPQPTGGTQTGWLFCANCQGLFYGPGAAVSACPRGGRHDGSKSHTYVLGYTS